MKADFHVHSTASDGTLTAAELKSKAEKAGIRPFAITDHDTLTAAADGITGIELSVEPEEGIDSFHLLGYGFDTQDEGLGAMVADIVRWRDERNVKITENFRRLGIAMPEKPGGEEVVARPHYAAWLVAHGYAADMAEAFAKYLLGDSPAATKCYEPRKRPSASAAIAAIHGAGGIAVMAHPKFLVRSWRREGVDFAAAERAIGAMRERGLDGLEALYSANTVEESVRFVRMADSLGLVKTAGSDYHGDNKPGIGFGMELDEDYIKPFLERVQT